MSDEGVTPGATDPLGTEPLAPDPLAGGLADRLAELAPGPELAAALAQVPLLSTLCSTELALVLAARQRQVCFEQAQLLAAALELALTSWQAPPEEPTARMAELTEFSADQVGFTLTWTRSHAQGQVELAQALIRRLPMVYDALRSGRLDLARAALFTNQLRHLDDDTARAIATKLLDKATTWDYVTLRRKLREAAVRADPGLARRQYLHGVAERSVHLWQADNGTANLSASNLPVVKALMIDDNLDRLAGAAKAMGDPRTLTQLRTDAMIDLLRSYAFTVTPSIDPITQLADDEARAEHQAFREALRADQAQWAARAAAPNPAAPNPAAPNAATPDVTAASDSAAPPSATSDSVTPHAASEPDATAEPGATTTGPGGTAESGATATNASDGTAGPDANSAPEATAAPNTTSAPNITSGPEATAAPSDSVAGGGDVDAGGAPAADDGVGGVVIDAAVVGGRWSERTNAAYREALWRASGRHGPSPNAADTPPDDWDDPWEDPSGGEEFPHHLFPHYLDAELPTTYHPSAPLPAPTSAAPTSDATTTPASTAPASTASASADGAQGETGALRDDAVKDSAASKDSVAGKDSAAGNDTAEGKDSAAGDDDAPSGAEHKCPGCGKKVVIGPRRGVADIVVGLNTLMCLSDNPGIVPGWGVVIADVARQLVLDPENVMRWRLNVVDDNGRLLTQAYTRRRPNAEESAFIEARDLTCRAPGCSKRAMRCDVDHRDEHANGGLSTRANGCVLCRHHHRLRHEMKLEHTINIQGTTLWHAPDGRIFAVANDSYLYFIGDDLDNLATPRRPVNQVIPRSRHQRGPTLRPAF